MRGIKGIAVVTLIFLTSVPGVCRAENAGTSSQQAQCTAQCAAYNGNPKQHAACMASCAQKSGTVSR